MKVKRNTKSKFTYAKLTKGTKNRTRLLMQNYTLETKNSNYN